MNPTNRQTIPLLVEARREGEFALFPGESGGGVVLSQDEMLALSRVYSRLYETYVSRLAVRLATRFDIAEAAAKVLARRGLVPVINCFLDRLVRVHKAIASAPGQLATPRQQSFPALGTAEAFERCAVEDPAFNQSVVSFVGGIWDLPEADAIAELATFKPQARFRNNLFEMYPRVRWGLIKRVGLELLARLPRARYPTLTMANATRAFREHGFYFTFLKSTNLKWTMVVGEPDSDLRQDIFSLDLFANPELLDFLRDLGLEDRRADRSIDLLKSFICSYYPSALLEGISVNMEQALRALEKTPKKHLIHSSESSSKAIYVMAAAKQRGFSLVDCQHGGHYGYIEDKNTFLETEYPDADQFVSWGWLRLPEVPANQPRSVVALPSPWLSERKRYWRRHSIDGPKEFDVLLMPNLVKRFPEAPGGAATSRIDLIQGYAADLKSIVLSAAERDISILHKPYNTTTVNLLPNTMQELDSLGGSGYLRMTQLDKGMTHDLVGRCHMVLWDQPGTGFLECISSNIPTLVYWPRTFNREESWAEPLFADLERVGVVHRGADTLMEEVVMFKRGSRSWMSDPERVSVLSRFSREFGWTSDDWPEQWRRYFEGLS
jgi:putative transferase (TIGR04331 family)